MSLFHSMKKDVSGISVIHSTSLWEKNLIFATPYHTKGTNLLLSRIQPFSIFTFLAMYPYKRGVIPAKMKKSEENLPP